MAIFYILLFIAAMMFAGQFLLTKQFQKLNGNSLTSTLKLSFFAFLAIAVFFFIKAQIGAESLRFGFSFFTLGMTLGIAVVSVLCTYLGIKVLGIGNMSVYSVFMMIGSMVLPSLVGLLFYSEPLTPLKGVAIVLMLLAVVFTAGSDDKKADKKAIFYYIGVFILNGLIGVFFTVHNNQPLLTAYYEMQGELAVANSDVFMCWYGISTALLSGVLLLVLRIAEKKKQSAQNADAVEEKQVENVETKDKKEGAKALLLSVGIAVLYGVVNGLGNYFISLGTMPGALGSSVTFPVVNGGTIVFSTLLGFFVFKEKITWKTWVGLAIVILSTVLFMLAQ